jgi:hypothetical protein
VQHKIAAHPTFLHPALFFSFAAQGREEELQHEVHALEMLLDRSRLPAAAKIASPNKQHPAAADDANKNRPVMKTARFLALQSDM